MGVKFPEKKHYVTLEWPHMYVPVSLRPLPDLYMSLSCQYRPGPRERPLGTAVVLPSEFCDRVNSDINTFAQIKIPFNIHFVLEQIGL